MRSLCLALAVIASAACAAQQPASPATASVSVPTTSNTAATARNSVRELPSDVPANPPKNEDLKAANRTWRGEYEADAIGIPLLGPDGRALPILYDKKGKRVRSVVKVPRTHPITIAEGTLTVDGWTGKARLNHDIPDLRYIYLSAPSIGTVVVAQTAFKGATEQKAAFSGATLTITLDQHQLQLASDKPLIGKHPASAWVKVDPTYTADPRYPVMGYGSGLTPPYEWPGAKAVAETGAKDAPPLPNGMLPKLSTGCAAGKPCADAKPSSVAASPPSK